LREVQRRPGLLHLRFGGLDLSQGGKVSGFGRIQIVFGNEIFPEKDFVSFKGGNGVAQGDFGFFQIGAGQRKIGGGLGHLRLKRSGIDLGQKLALSDRGIVIDKQRLDRSGHLRADQNGRDGIDGSRGGNRSADVAPVRRLGDILRHRFAAAEKDKQGDQNQDQDDACDKNFLHGVFAPMAFSRLASAMLKSDKAAM